MAQETTESFVSTINVRQLISVFENKKAEEIDYSYSRPRAKSWGNILGDDVVVRYNDYYTLQDIKEALRKVETNLNFYQVYDKQKHVAFQEQLFNILTSVVNIETETDDDPAQKKNLITKTQTLVSFLNQKLPNVRSPLKSAYSKNVIENKNDNDDNVFSEYTETIDNNIDNDSVVDTGEYSVSVKTLKKNFQVQEVTDNEASSQRQRVAKSLKSKGGRLSTKRQKSEPGILTIGNDVRTAPQLLENGTENNSNESNANVPPTEKKVDTSEDIEPAEVAKVVSVSKLRNLFEEKGKEESSGLEVALDAPRTFQYDVNIPYTEGNLGKYRLYRANSGNYLNYTGLLQKTDINRKKSDITRSKSMHAFNYNKYVAYKDQKKATKRSSADSGEESDSSSASIDSVKEVKINQWSAVQGKVYLY